MAHLDLSDKSSVENARGQAAAEPTVLRVAKEEAIPILTAFREWPRASDRSEFDVQARAATFGTDPLAAYAFVRDHIRTELYPGVLRGSRGTLQAAAGNDLDKSVLLADLLRVSQRRVRFAHCILAPEAAMRRVPDLFAPMDASRAVRDDGPTLREALVRAGLDTVRAGEIVQGRRAWQDWLDAAVFETALADLATVRSALEQSGIRPQPAPAGAITEEARSHYWLQMETSGAWQDLDASAPHGPAETTGCRPDETFDELPEQAYQSITVSVRNQWLQEGALADSVVLTHRFRASDLYGRVLSFSNLGFASGSGPMSGTHLDRLVPFLWTENLVVPGDEFTVLPPSGAGGPSASLDDALGGGPSPPVLAAQWLDFRIDAPGRSTVTSRAVVDAASVGKPAADGDTDVLQASLAQTYAIAVSSGPISRSAAIESVLSPLDMATLASASVAPTENGGEEARRKQAIADLDSARLRLAAIAYASAAERALSALNARLDPGVRLVRDQPAITIANRAIRQRPAGKEAASEIWIDLRHDKVRVLTDSPTHVVAGYWANALRGLLGGAVEHHLTAGTGQGFDTSEAMRLARGQGIAVVAGPGDIVADRLRSEQADVGGSRMAGQITADMAVIAPAQPVVVGGEPRMALWALDRRTGDLLPLLDTGMRGDAAAERASLEANLKELEMLVRQCVASPARASECRRMFGLWKEAAQALADHVSTYPWSTPLNFPVEVIYF